MKKILVAEDEQAIREFVVINLRRAGYDIYEASNGEEAVAVYEREKGAIDVAVLDIMMPGSLDGLAVCGICGDDPLALSCLQTEMDKVSEVGADDMYKPFSPSELGQRDAVYRRGLCAGAGRTFQRGFAAGDFVLNSQPNPSEEGSSH